MTRALDALVAERVLDDDLRATTDERIGRAVMDGMRASNGDSTADFRWDGCDFNRVSLRDGGYFALGKGSNDGHGLLIWCDREGMEWQGAIERHVDAWRKKPRPYSSDIAAAWTVVEAMRAKGWEDEHRNESAMTNWTFCRKAPLMGKPNIGRARGARHKGDAVLICLAALRAVGLPEDEIQAALK